MTEEELRTLYNLLDKYNKEQDSKYGWWDVDTIDFILEEIDDSAGGVFNVIEDGVLAPTGDEEENE